MYIFARRMLRDKWKSFVTYAITTVVFLEMYIALFPAIQKQAGQVNQLLKTMPPELFKAMNMDPSALSFGNLQSYLSTEYMSFLWPILVIIFAISLANFISVNEIDKGTIETLASLPAKRSRVFMERYATGLLLIAALCVVGMLGAIPLAQLHNTGFIFDNFFTATVGSFVFAWAVYSLAALFSVIFSEKGKSTMATGGVLILMYVIFIISTLKDSLKNLQYTSFFNYFSGSDLLAKNTYPDYAFLALGVFAIIATIAALFWFNRRDLSV